MIKPIKVFLFICLCFFTGYSQPPVYSTSDIQLKLQKLNVLGSALYFAAHPDDENTKMITYLSKKRHIRVGYLSLTRGDGGQNMIGTEKGELLGVIRTQELLAARRIDGGEQFFTRANDFGYSKTHHETLNIWDEEQVLEDMVFVIRKFKPDVIINRFPPLEKDYDTHGHHSASAYLAEKAFDMAADPKVFPEQLKYVEVWQPKRLLWNTSTWFYRRTGTELDPESKVVVDVGAYVPLLGLSCTEIAAESRSQHKSQGFGAAKSRGEELEYLDPVRGDGGTAGIFEDIDISWDRVDGSDKIAALLSKTAAEFDPTHGKDILPELLQAYQLVSKRNDYWSKIKTEEIKEVVAAICGLYLEATANDFSAVAGEPVQLTVTALNRSSADVEMKEISYSFGKSGQEISKVNLEFNKPFELHDSLSLSKTLSLSQPYWLTEQPENIGMYKVNDRQLRGLAETPDELMVSFKLSMQDVDLQYNVPLQHKWTDRVEGELYRDFIITPEVTVNLKEKVIIFSDQSSKEVLFRVKAWKDDVPGELKLPLPKGWKSEPESHSFKLEKKGDEKIFSFKITPSKQSGVYELKPVITTATGDYSLSYVELDYEHIPIQNLWPPATTKLVKLDIATKGKKIGYIMGAGDEVADNLTQISYHIQMITENNIIETDLAQFDAVIVGIRAYNTEKWLVQYHDKLMDYVRQGGNVIVQYQTTRGLLTEEIGPYPFKIGRGRVTVEEAPMQILHIKHKVFNEPNKITQEDFENWVQERGLYFAETWDDQYTPLLSAHDPGEEPLQGSLIVADYGEGAFMYTGISFFRELPAGVPGAYRLLANMISYGK